jgi:hypothetical protein
VAPSVYLARIEKKGQAASNALNGYLQTHMIDVGACRADDFHSYFLKRAISILNAIESATGKIISGRDSDSVINDFGGKLI